MLSQKVNQFTFNAVKQTISKIDKKGRISIPISLRAKLGWLEGSKVSINLNGDRLILLQDGQNGVKVSIGTCGVSGPGSIPGSGLGKNRGGRK